MARTIVGPVQVVIINGTPVIYCDGEINTSAEMLREFKWRLEAANCPEPTFHDVLVIAQDIFASAENPSLEILTAEGVTNV